MIAFLLLCALLTVHASPPSSFCYNNCSNNGRCVSNVCVCYEGYFGENCSKYLGKTPLSVGILVQSTAELNRILIKNECVMIGVSATHCAACSQTEEEYLRVQNWGKSKTFIRLDAVKQHELLLQTFAGSDFADLPAMAMSWNFGKRKAKYRGAQTAKAIERFLATKCHDNPTRPVSDSAYWIWPDVVTPPTIGWNTDVRFTAVAFFPSKNYVEDYEDEWEEFVIAADDLRSRHDVHPFVVVLNKNDPREFWHPPKYVKLPAMGFAPATKDKNVRWTFITMTEAIPPSILSQYASNPAMRSGLSRWIALQTASEASPLTGENFVAAEDLGLPMLLLFYPDEITLTNLLPAFRDASDEFRGRMTFLFGDSKSYGDRLVILGLNHVNTTIYATMAINTKDGIGPYPFIGANVTQSSFRMFCLDFFAGRALPMRAMPLLGTSLTNDDDTKDEPDVIGVSESFHSGDVNIIDATTQFNDVVLNEYADVIVLAITSRNCQPCKNVAPYYKKIAKRFDAVKNTTDHHVVVTIVDLTKRRARSMEDIAPPLIMLFPAYKKMSPPLKFTGELKVYTVMEWVRHNSGRPFKWGEELPQFDLLEKQMFREQIKERELRRIAKEEEEAEMEAEQHYAPAFVVLDQNEEL